jgi:hypothetical protein
MNDVPPGDRRLNRWEWAIVATTAALVLYYAVMTEIRSCFLQRRMTDFGVYLRAAWAARTGHDLYAVTCNNGWHYCYPPPFALLLTPLADPPAGFPRAGYLPYPVSVGIWVLASYAFAFWTVQALARRIVPEAVPGSRRWWSARLGPLLVCAPGIGYTIVHGQVNTLVAALITAMVLAGIAGRRLAAGVWLAAAAALKVVPAFLFLVPLLHRDRRAVLGVVLGAVLVLGVLPAGFFGIVGTQREYEKFVDQVLVPGTTGGGDQTRAKELTATVATDSHSFQAVIHNWRNPTAATRPPNADSITRLAHWAIIAGMTAVTLWVGGRHRKGGPPDQLVLVAAFVLVMVLASPVSHVHHYAMALPAIAGLWLKGLTDRPGHAWPAGAITVPLVVWCAATGLPLIPTREFVLLREFGLGTAATVAIWLICLDRLSGRWCRPEIGTGQTAARSGPFGACHFPSFAAATRALSR